METFVKSEIVNSVARITLSRPDKRNALKRDFIDQLNVAVEAIANDESVRVLVLDAEGTVFCAGMDLGEMQERAASDSGKQEWQKDSEVYARLLSSLFHLNIPTVVRLQGPVLAGGVGMVLACDFVVASESAFVMLPEPIRGITAAMVTPFLAYRAGAAIATNLLLSAQRMTATRAYDLGLFHAVVGEGQLDAEIKTLLDSILSGSRDALAITKRHLRNCGAGKIEKLLQQSISVSAEARETNDAREGLAAFLEKRKPNWQQ